MKTLDLFSGIGGFALAGQMVGGFEIAQFVEIDPYCQKVLAKNFPGVPIHDDIRTFTAMPGEFDCITGGFPCQDISIANANGRGLEGGRSGLFFELMRIVCECRPRYIVLENVSNLLNSNDGRDMGTVLWALAESGYDAEWQIISAASVGAPHLRERIFIVAHRDSKRRNDRRDYREKRHIHGNFDGEAATAPQERCKLQFKPRPVGKTDAHTNGSGCEKFNSTAISSNSGHDTRRINPEWNPWRTEPGILRVAHGVPDRVDRIRALGNAVVPQAAAIALQRVKDLESISN